MNPLTGMRWRRLFGGCSNTTLVLNTAKIKEVVVDYRKKNKEDIQPLFWTVWRCWLTSSSRVSPWRRLSPGMLTPQHLWKKPSRNYFFSDFPGNNNFLRNRWWPSNAALQRASWHTVACVWFASCTAADRKALQIVNTTAKKIIGCSQPSLQKLYSSRWLKKAWNSLRKLSHPGNSMFELLPSGKRYRTFKTKSNWLIKMFPKPLLPSTLPKI